MTESYVLDKNRNTYSRSISFTRFTCDVNGRKSDSNRVFFSAFHCAVGLKQQVTRVRFPPTSRDPVPIVALQGHKNILMKHKAFDIKS